jgi:hypothetical protein
MLQSKGRGKDTILAHITPKEAELLKKRGGSGTRNPDTGLLEYDPEIAAGSTVGSDVTVTAGQDAPAPDVYVPSETYAAPQGVTGVTPAETTTFTPETYSFPNISPSGETTGQTPFTLQTPNLTQQNQDAALQASSEELAGSAAAPDSGNAPVTTPASKGFFGKMTGQDLARLGLAGAGGLAGALQSRKASKQIEAAQREQQAMAQPYQKMGNELVGQASKGILSSASQQAYQAAQAQLTQNAQNRGGVGVEQAQNQLAMIRTNLLNNQMQYGLQIAQVGDRMALGAIQTGLQLDQQLNQTSQAFYTQLASIAAGLPMYRA